MKSILRRLWPYISNRRRKQFLLLLVVMVVTSFAEVISIGAVLPFLGVLVNPERIFNHDIMQPLILLLNIDAPQQLLFPITTFFIVAALTAGVMRVSLLYIQVKLGQAIGADISVEIYKRTLYQPYSVHIGRNSSEVIAGISSKANQLVSGLIMPVFTIASSIFIVSAILYALVLVNPIISISVLFGFSLIYMAIIKSTKGYLVKNSEKISREHNHVIKALQEGLGGIRDVLIDSSQSAYCKVYQVADLQLRQAHANVAFVAGSPRFVIESLGIVLISIIAYVF